MSIITTLYFKDNVNIDQLFRDLRAVTGVSGLARETVDGASQTISRIVPPEIMNQESPGISMLCKVTGMLHEMDTFDGEQLLDVECWVEVDIYSRVSQFSLADMHVAYIMGLNDKGYNFRWRQYYTDEVYESTDSDNLLQYCEMHEKRVII